MPGVPVGLGTAVYLLWALAMPVAGLTRAARGIEAVRWPVVVAQVSIATGMLAGLFVTIWLFSLLSVASGQVGAPPAVTLVRELPVPASLALVGVIVVPVRALRRTRERRARTRSVARPETVRSL